MNVLLCLILLVSATTVESKFSCSVYINGAGIGGDEASQFWLASGGRGLSRADFESAKDGIIHLLIKYYCQAEEAADQVVSEEYDGTLGAVLSCVVTLALKWLFGKIYEKLTGVEARRRNEEREAFIERGRLMERGERAVMEIRATGPSINFA